MIESAEQLLSRGAMRKFKHLLRMEVYNKVKFEFVYFSNAAGPATATVGQGLIPLVIRNDPRFTNTKIF